jgi:hypothetical protein
MLVLMLILYLKLIDGSWAVEVGGERLGGARCEISNAKGIYV